MMGLGRFEPFGRLRAPPSGPMLRVRVRAPIPEGNGATLLATEVRQMSTQDPLTIPSRTAAAAILLWMVAFSLLIAGAFAVHVTREYMLCTIMVTCGAAIMTVISWLRCHVSDWMQDAYTMGRLSVVPKQHQPH